MGHEGRDLQYSESFLHQSKKLQSYEGAGDATYNVNSIGASIAKTLAAILATEDYPSSAAFFAKCDRSTILEIWVRRVVLLFDTFVAILLSESGLKICLAGNSWEVDADPFGQEILDSSGCTIGIA